MKKGTKLVALLLGIALVAPACNNKPSTSQAPVESSSISGETSNSSSSAAQESSSNTPSSSTSSEAPVNYTVTISNKTALQADWFVGDAARKVEISVEPRANVTQLVSEGKIVITSSDATKVSVVGQMATPVAEGQVTLTVRCGQSQDTVAINLQPKQTTKTKYGVEHEGTAEDPFTNEDAVRVAQQTDKYNGEDFYVRGEVESFYHAPGSRTDGAVSWYYKAATAGGDRFEVYKCYKAEGTGSAKYLTDDDIWVGAVVTAHGKFTMYGTQAETDGAAVFVKAEGEKPAPRTTVEKTFAEALAAGIALADGADTYDYYKFQGYVSAKSGNNYFLTETKGEALVTATSDEAHQSREYYSNAIELYFSAAPAAEIAAKLLDGAKVEVTTVIKNYHGTVENCFALTNDDIVLKEPGTAWAIPEPEVATKTVTEFAALEDNGKKEKAYSVTAEIKSWKNATAAKDKYGNMVITDGTTDLIIYGATATTTALAWDNASAYAFSNPNDFLTNTVTQALAVGNTITMKLVRADFKNSSTGDVTIEGTGVITNVVAVATTAIALNKASEEVEVGKTVTLTATRTPENSNTPCEWISSDDTVATVEGGVVTGVAAGTATITAKISDEIKAECTVTVKAVEGNKLVLDKIGTNVASDYVTAETEAAVGDYKIMYNNAKKQGDSILLKQGTGYFYLKTAVPGAIKKVTLYINPGAAGKAEYGIAFSATAMTGKVEASNYVNIAGGANADFTCSVENATYLCVSVNNEKNGQVLKLEIQYE